MQTKHKLYLDRVLNSWGDRSWEFAVNLYTIKIHGSSLSLMAIQGIFASITIILLTPVIGRWIERESRLNEMKVCLVIQNSATVVSCIFLTLFFIKENISNQTLVKVIEFLAPIVLIIFSAMSQLFSYAYSLCLEKDWIIVLARSEEELSEWNSMLQRIDLCCKTIAPSVIGYLMELSNLFSVLFIMIWNIVSVVFEYLVLKSIFDHSTDKLSTPKPESSSELKLFDINEFKHYYGHFLLPGTAFALLFLTVIGFDYESESIPGYLNHQGINEGAIGLINLTGALFGILGSFIFRHLSTKMSLERVGLFGFMTNALLSFLCLAEVWNTGEKNTSMGINLKLSLFLAGLLATRPGLWMADLAVNQMIQTDTPFPATIGSVQISVNLTAELFKFIILALMPRFDQFTILIAMSLIPGTLAAILFGIYNLRHESHLPVSLLSSSLTLPTLHPRSQTGCILREGKKHETSSTES